MKIFLIKTVLILILSIICFLPTEIYLVFRWIASPTGFWQEFLMGVTGLFVLGGVQLMMGIVWVCGIFAIVVEKPQRTI